MTKAKSCRVQHRWWQLSLLIKPSETNRKFWLCIRIPQDALRLSACKLCGNETRKELENVPQGQDNSQLSYLQCFIWSSILTISLPSEKRLRPRVQFIIALLTSLQKTTNTYKQATNVTWCTARCYPLGKPYITLHELTSLADFSNEI